MAETNRKKRKQQPLASNQVRHLRGLGHHLKPMVMLGREGLSDSLLKAVEEVLDAHELVKVKIQENFPDDRQEGAAALAKRSGAWLVQVIGKTFLLYRQNPDLPADRRIALPAPKKQP